MANTDPRRRRPWTADEDAVVSDSTLTDHEVMTRTGRTLAAVRRRKGVLHRLGGGIEQRARSRGKEPPLLHREPRPCSNCQRLFQPTMRRRMLCISCFHRGDKGPYAA